MKKVFAFLFVLACTTSMLSAAETDDIRDLTTKVVDRHTCQVLPKLVSDQHNALYFTMPSLTVAGAFREGADGETRAEWERLLGFKPGDEVALRRLSEYFASRDGFSYRFASAVFLPPKHSVLPRYLDYVRETHGAEVRPVDFSSQAHIDSMNTWFEEASGIKEVIAKGDLPGNTEVVVASACKLELQWTSKLSLSSGSFFVGEKEVHPRFCEGEYSGLYESSFAGYDVLIVPMKGNTYLWLIRGSAPADLPKIAAELSKKGFNAFARPRAIDGSTLLRMPEFGVAFEKDLISLFRSLGIEKSFGEESDFSRMCAREIFIGKMQLKAELEFDRYGIRGGQVVYGAGVPRGLSLSDEPDVDRTIVIDRPFLAMLTEESSGAVMALFSVVDPTLEK